MLIIISYIFSSRIDNNKHTFFSPKPRRSLLGAYQDLKHSIAKAFEVRTQNSNSQMNKSLPLLASMYKSINFYIQKKER